MSNKTNEEKLRILQERLTQIKQKETTSTQTPQVDEIPSSQTDKPQKENTKKSFKWVKYVIIIGGIGYISSYAYKNINFDFLKSEETINTEKSEKDKQEEATLDFPGNSVAIIAKFEEEGLAKAMVNDLIVKGFKADYFYLPYKSNSTEEVYKVFIGPYENKEEANQWLKNIESENHEIISL